MKKFKFVNIILLITFGHSFVLHAETPPGAEQVDFPPEVVGLSMCGKEVTVFVTYKQESRTLDAIGKRIGPFELVKVDATSEYADFRNGEKTVRVWLNSANIKTFVSEETNAPVTVMVPALDKIKKLIIADDIPKEKAERIIKKQLDRILNDPKISVDERKKRLEKILNGESPIILVGKKGMSEEEAQAKGLAPGWATESNRVDKLADELFKNVKPTKPEKTVSPTEPPKKQ